MNKKLVFKDRSTENKFLVQISKSNPNENGCNNCFRWKHNNESYGFNCAEIQRQLGSCKNGEQIYFKFLKCKIIKP